MDDNGTEQPYNVRPDTGRLRLAAMAIGAAAMLVVLYALMQMFLPVGMPEDGVSVELDRGTGFRQAARKLAGAGIWEC